MSASGPDLPLVPAMSGPGQPLQGPGTQVELTLAGLEPRGKVMAQVYADAAAMKSRQGAVMSFAVDPGGAPSVRTVLPMPPGRYAMALFQDTKGTGKMETRMGMPLVPFGFSRNARGTFGPPSFDAAAFDVADAPVQLAVTLA